MKHGHEFLPQEAFNGDMLQVTPKGANTTYEYKQF
jgi:hypothetical protein